MWGEIDPPVKAQPRPRESEKRTALPEEPADPLQTCDLYIPKHRAETQPVARLDPSPEHSCVGAMIESVAMSGSPVKSQQIGEAELTFGERREELLHQYRSRPLVFLERYHGHLKPEHLPAFAHVSSDPRAQHYSRLVQTRPAGCTNKTRVRNQRYAALRALQKDGEYFSEEQMRMREPLLYEQYIGQFLTDEEVVERSQEAMLDGAQEGQGGGPCGLANLLLNSYQERLIQNRLQEEQDREDGAQEEDEDDDDDGVQQRGWEPTAEEKALMREEFISQMHQRFLDGKDKDFNYSEVDDNPDYDNLDIVSRDAEDKYFDEDDDSEEEEMERDDDDEEKMAE
ncbi:coiled-coil domain-containing protein 97 isoform X1 [Poeciliopsis prolifica]|nr:coiled-coil domain-containing protein 97 isoform X1 [Poeciliopsis prolifica]XP_054890933.1 coiled-coil domain-containing protein 97 isoform X1 [Poeciliopsis prolifica]XP_054890934.1 coiled-coil domain-containing protein 97 isoform X1 [Poeciliopsis prolifica]